MTPVEWREHIVSDQAILGGKPILKGTRLSVEFVLELLAGGWDDQSMQQNYAYLTEVRVRAVLAYAAEMWRQFR